MYSHGHHAMGGTWWWCCTCCCILRTSAGLHAVGVPAAMQRLIGVPVLVVPPPAACWALRIPWVQHSALHPCCSCCCRDALLLLHRHWLHLPPCCCCWCCSMHCFPFSCCPNRLPHSPSWLLLLWWAPIPASCCGLLQLVQSPAQLPAATHHPPNVPSLPAAVGCILPTPCPLPPVHPTSQHSTPTSATSAL